MGVFSNNRDLAARNVMRTKDGRMKITDFGLSRKILTTLSYTQRTYEDTIPFYSSAPEAISCKDSRVYRYLEWIDTLNRKSEWMPEGPLRYRINQIYNLIYLAQWRMCGLGEYLWQKYSSEENRCLGINRPIKLLRLLSKSKEYTSVTSISISIYYLVWVLIYFLSIST